MEKNMNVCEGMYVVAVAAVAVMGLVCLFAMPEDDAPLWWFATVMVATKVSAVGLFRLAAVMWRRRDLWRLYE